MTTDDLLTYMPQEPGEVFVVDLDPLRTRRYVLLRTYEGYPLNVALPDKTTLLYLSIFSTWNETCYVFLASSGDEVMVSGQGSFQPKIGFLRKLHI